MKLRLAVGLVLILFSLVIVLHSQPQSVSSDEGRILALETAWNHAEQAKMLPHWTSSSHPSLCTLTTTAAFPQSQSF